MKILLVDNVHIFKDENGNYFSPSIYDEEFFQRYLNVFDDLRMVAKVKQIRNEDAENLIQICDKRIEVYEIPWYHGLKELIKKLFPVINAYRKASIGCDCSILRVAQIESFFAFLFSDCRNKPLAVEMVNDPLGWTNVNRLIKSITVTMTRKILCQANGASYVTEHYLQNRYPCKNALNGKGFSASYSSIKLYESEIVENPKSIIGNPIRLVHISNIIDGDAKGHKEAIDIITELNKKSFPCNLTFIGDGPSKEKFRNYAIQMGVNDKIKFVGRISSHTKIMQILRDSDVFIFPVTSSEGLPRVLIEAMAAGLPCLSSPYGGMQELLEPNYLIDPVDAKQYASVIINICEDLALYKKISSNNIQKAKSYTKNKLDAKRNIFYTKLKEYTVENKGAK